jgi:hypothetical protein
MEARRVPQTCKWAESTLHQSWPMWLDAWAWPWTCRADGAPKLLPTTSECLTCARWERRDANSPAPAFTGVLLGQRCGPSY